MLCCSPVRYRLSAGEAESILKTSLPHGKARVMAEQQRKRYRYNHHDDGTGVDQHKHRNAKGDGKQHTYQEHLPATHPVTQGAVKQMTAQPQCGDSQRAPQTTAPRIRILLCGFLRARLRALSRIHMFLISFMANPVCHFMKKFC